MEVCSGLHVSLTIIRLGLTDTDSQFSRHQGVATINPAHGHHVTVGNRMKPLGEILAMPLLPFPPSHSTCYQIVCGDFNDESYRATLGIYAYVSIMCKLKHRQLGSLLAA